MIESSDKRAQNFKRATQYFKRATDDYFNGKACSVAAHHLNEATQFRDKAIESINNYDETNGLKDELNKLIDCVGALDDDKYASSGTQSRYNDNDVPAEKEIEAIEDIRAIASDGEPNDDPYTIVNDQNKRIKKIAHMFQPELFSRIFIQQDEAKKSEQTDADAVAKKDAKYMQRLFSPVLEGIQNEDRDLDTSFGPVSPKNLLDYIDDWNPDFKKGLINQLQLKKGASETSQEKGERLYEEYGLEMLSNFIYWCKDRYAAEKRERECERVLRKFKNVVLHGAPGTGKTYMAKEVAAKLIDCKVKDLDNSDRFGFVQFHPSYDYTDFVEGLRPFTKDSDGVGFRLEPGTFKKFCDTARKAWEAGEKKKKYVFVIDEINRGDISKIFGELFFSIDPDYRGSKGSVSTQYSNMHENREEKFYVPENVYVIGTMNDIDRSVDSFDYAMRRRFKFVEVTPVDSQVMLYSKPWYIAAKDRMNQLNTGSRDVTKSTKGVRGILGARYQIGASYFMELAGSKDEAEFNKRLKQLWRQSLRPLLVEYARDAGVDEKKVDEIGKGIKLMEKEGDKQGRSSELNVVEDTNNEDDDWL